MLVVLPHGTCVDPEIVKLVTIRVDRPQGPGKPMVFTVAMKTEADDNYVLLATFDEREEAEALAVECAKRVNKALGGGDDEDAGSDDEDEDEDEAPAKADVDDDW